MKYANISIEQNHVKGNENGIINIGDHVQLLAIDYLYSLMNITEVELIEYYDLYDYNGHELVLPVNFIYFNPFVGEKAQIWSKNIKPVFLGIHTLGSFDEEEKNYLNSNGPVGCRDYTTYKRLGEQGINAYMQGCISVIFPKRETNDYQITYMVDVPEVAEMAIPSYILENARKETHVYYGDKEEICRQNGVKNIKELTRNRIKLYRDTAKLVITGRLHCATICIAMGIPVVFIVESNSSRFTNISQYITVYTKDKWSEIDWAGQTVDIEKDKAALINCAKKRILEFNDDLCDKVDGIFARDKVDDRALVDDLTRLKDFSVKWENADNLIPYVLWGGTYLAIEANKWIKQNFAGELIAVIDEYRDIEIDGIKSMRSDQLASVLDSTDCYVVACGDSTSIAAREYFEKNRPEECGRLCTLF